MFPRLLQATPAWSNSPKILADKLTMRTVLARRWREGLRMDHACTRWRNRRALRISTESVATFERNLCAARGALPICSSRPWDATRVCYSRSLRMFSAHSTVKALSLRVIANLVDVLTLGHEALFSWRQTVARTCPEHIQGRPQNHADEQFNNQSANDHDREWPLRV
jgi:hypothetical protein